VLGAIGRAARLGAIVKGGVFMEALSRTDTVAFDKTGTLTAGAPEILAMAPEPGHTGKGLLAAGAVAECRSEHPLAKAILARAEQMGLPAEEPAWFESISGGGITARSRAGDILVGSEPFLNGRGVQVHAAEAPGGCAASAVHVAVNGTHVGRIWIADLARKEAKAVIHRIHDLGIRTILLTGDGSRAAKALGQELGIDQVEAGLLPVHKQSRIADLKREGCRVAMVGDGVNDAPAMVEAQVGIAMGSGTDVARETADVVLIGNDLSKLVEALMVARRMRRIILQNFAGTLVVDGIGVGLAAFGWLNPLLAAFIHVASELAFILNSTRLLPRRAGQ